MRIAHVLETPTACTKLRLVVEVDGGYHAERATGS
jgi:very-short-patch-repair endonuclease